MTKSKEDRRSVQWLAAQDRLDDLMAGFELWKNMKCGGAELTTLDEMFIRWVEATPGQGNREGLSEC